jgi:hypothetical protein
MSDELVNQQISSNAEIDELDHRILRALEDAPELHIPADFAVRVSRQLPARRPVSLTPTHYGRNAVLIGMVITLVALLALTLHNGTTAAFGLTQSLLLAQFIALTVWLSIRRQSFN